MNKSRLLFISNFNTERETIYFGYEIDLIKISNGFILLEFLFENKSYTTSAFKNMVAYIHNKNLKKVIEVKPEQIEVEVEIINIWISLSENKKNMVEIKMPH